MKIRNAKPRAKPYRLADGGNLYLYVAPTGVRSWQLRYRHAGKSQTATLGKWPTLSLAQARVEADQQRALVSKGNHLTRLKRATQLKQAYERGSTFGVLAAAWLEREARIQHWSDRYRREVKSSLSNHLAVLNNIALNDLTVPVVGPALLRTEKKAPHMVEKVRRRLNAILDYAVEQGIMSGNPLPAIRRRKKAARRHYPAVTDLTSVGEILRAARAVDCCRGVQRAHVLAAFTGMRISEIVGATWAEFELYGVYVSVQHGLNLRFDSEAGNWTIPRRRMKQSKAVERGPHVVPLSPRLLSQLREWRREDGEEATYVCRAPRDASKPITIEAVEKFYRRALHLGGKHSPHSWRATFSTIARDAGRDGDVIEAQLDHVVGNKVVAAYDRAKRLELRRELMRWYEDQLCSARDYTKVVSLHAVALIDTRA